MVNFEMFIYYLCVYTVHIAPVTAAFISANLYHQNHQTYAFIFLVLAFYGTIRNANLLIDLFQKMDEENER